MTSGMVVVGILLIVWSVVVRGVPGSEHASWRQRHHSSGFDEIRGLPGVGARYAPVALRVGAGLILLAAAMAYVDSSR